MMIGNVVDKIGDRAAQDVTRKDVIDLVLYCSSQLKLATVLVDHYTARWLGFYSKKQD